MFEKAAGTVVVKVTNMVEMGMLARDGKSLEKWETCGIWENWENWENWEPKYLSALVIDPLFATSREKTGRYLEPGPQTVQPLVLCQVGAASAQTSC